MKCPKCKNPNEANSQLCEWCGAELIENTNNINNSTNSTTDTTTISYKPEKESKTKTNLPIASIVISLGIIFLSFYMLTELQKNSDLEHFNGNAEWIQKNYETSFGEHIDLIESTESLDRVIFFINKSDDNLVIPIIILVSIHFFVSIYFLVCTIQGKKSKMIILIISLVISLGVILLSFISLTEIINLLRDYYYLPDSDIEKIQDVYLNPDGDSLNLIKVAEEISESRYFLFDFRALITVIMILSSLLFFVSINFLVSTIRNKKSIN